MFPVFSFLRKKIKSFFDFFSCEERHKYYWWVLRYMFIPRYSHLKIKLGDGLVWECVDIASFLSAYKSIFVDKIYSYNPGGSKTRQVIIDCGANIGLSVLFFKLKYSKSKVIAFEPDPEIFGVLQKNIKEAGLDDVILYNKAVWIRDEKLSFQADHADGGRIQSTYNGKTLVEGIDFNAFLQKQKHIDMLKIDIEGAESEVLAKCFPAISKADKIFFEYHSSRNVKQVLGCILEKFERHGYHYHILTEHARKTPFIILSGDPEMDLQVDFFLWKEKKKVLL